MVINPLKTKENHRKREQNPQIREKNMSSMEENESIKQDVDKAIRALENAGIDKNAHMSDTVGLGDVVETILKSVGITEERFKQLFNLKECNCTKRKAWLNSLLSWHRNSKQQ